MKKVRIPRAWDGIVLGLLLLSVGACGPQEPIQEVGEPATASEEAALEARLVAYAPKLAEAYATGNIEVLRDFAVERVLAQVEKRVSDLAVAGMLVEPEQQNLVIEEIQTFGNNFALVTTLETWDLRYYSTGTSHSLIEERLGTRNRVEYQMKERDGVWMIFFRELKQEFDAP